MKDLTPVRETCEGCGEFGTATEFRTGDEASYQGGLSVCARWSAPPAGWLTSFDDSGEHWVCSVACARKVDSGVRARLVLEERGKDAP